MYPRPIKIESLEPRRLLSAGELDLSFGTGGTQRLDLSLPADTRTPELIPTPDGGLLVSFGNDATYNTTLVKFTADGSRDQSFNGGEPRNIIRPIVGDDLSTTRTFIDNAGNIIVASSFYREIPTTER